MIIYYLLQQQPAGLHISSLSSTVCKSPSDEFLLDNNLAGMVKNIYFNDKLSPYISLPNDKNIAVMLIESLADVSMKIIPFLSAKSLADL